MDQEKNNVTFGSKIEVYWTTVHKNCKAEILRAANDTILNSEILKIAEKKITEEKAKLKK